MRYDWAVQVRHPWEKTPVLGTSVTTLTPNTKRVVQLPKYFGGRMGNGVGVVAGGGLYYYDNVDGRILRTGIKMFCHRDPGGAPLTSLNTDFTPIEATQVGATWTPFGGHAAVASQTWAQRNGRYAYLMFGRDSNQFGGAADMNIMRMWGPNPDQQKWLNIPNRLSSGAPTGPSASPTWFPGGHGSAYVTDHDRSPMSFLQDAWKTMAFLDNPDWMANFGLRNWYSTYESPTSTVRQGYSWAFYQEHAHPPTAVGCRIMPPINRYKAPTLWWFVIRNAAYRNNAAAYTCDMDVYRAKWMPDQWRPMTNLPYGATLAQANANRDHPFAVSQVDHIRKVLNPKRMGFETSWENSAHLVTTIRGLYYATIPTVTPHVDRASDGTPMVTLLGMGCRAGRGQGLVYFIIDGVAKLNGVIPSQPVISPPVLYGNFPGSNAALINDFPLATATEYLTSTGLSVGRGEISDKGKIYRRGELNRHSWLV